MREILFRGQRILKDGFAIGNLYRYSDGMCDIMGVDILFESEVIPETVGQFTGLKDKYSRMIFEGDIISDEERSPEDNIFVCEYINSEGGFKFVSPLDGECLDENNFCEDLKIIGNIYENSDIL